MWQTTEPRSALGGKPRRRTSPEFNKHSRRKVLCNGYAVGLR